MVGVEVGQEQGIDPAERKLQFSIVEPERPRKRKPRY